MHCLTLFYMKEQFSMPQNRGADCDAGHSTALHINMRIPPALTSCRLATVVPLPMAAASSSAFSRLRLARMTCTRMQWEHGPGTWPKENFKTCRCSMQANFRTCLCSMQAQHRLPICFPVSSCSNLLTIVHH